MRTDRRTTWSQTDTATDRELVTRARRHPTETASRRELVRRYQPLVLSMARRHHRSGGPAHDDVISIGQVGLLKAIRDYDLEREVPFAAYAKAKVRGEMLRWFRDSRYAVHVPRTLHETFMQVRGAQADLTSTLGREPTVDEVAAKLGIHADDVVEALAVNSAERARTSQLASSLNDEHGSGQLPEVELLAALNQFPERTRIVLYRRFWEGVSQREIGEELGVSQAHVSRIERGALDDLRSIVGSPAP